MRFGRLLSSVIVLQLWLFCGSGLAAEITAERFDGGVRVRIDGKLFTEYLTRSGSKPILWPIIGPTGKPVTRDFPMLDHAGEKKDHVHQRSLWFTHGEVNGFDFWTEAGGKAGTIRHVKFIEVAGGRPAVISTENAWLAPDGKKVCEDQRTLRFDTDGDARWIDFDVTIKASDGPVEFGDTKEGTFGMRVAETISVDAQQGGRIVNSRQQVDAATWGQVAEWVDYSGRIDGQTVGIAILNHPSSFRFPTRWQVRPYGLFAANPFGLKAFVGVNASGAKADSPLPAETKIETAPPNGAYTLSFGKTVTFRYRVLLHRGNENEGKVMEAFVAYAKETR